MTKRTTDLRRDAVEAIDAIAIELDRARAELVDAIDDRDTAERDLERSQDYEGEAKEAREQIGVLIDAAIEAEHFMTTIDASAVVGRPLYNLRLAIRNAEHYR